MGRMGGMGKMGGMGRMGGRYQIKKRASMKNNFMKALQGVIRFLFCAYILLYIM